RGQFVDGPEYVLGQSAAATGRSVQRSQSFAFAPRQERRSVDAEPVPASVLEIRAEVGVEGTLQVYGAAARFAGRDKQLLVAATHSTVGLDAFDCRRSGVFPDPAEDQQGGRRIAAVDKGLRVLASCRGVVQVQGKRRVRDGTGLGVAQVVPQQLQDRLDLRSPRHRRGVQVRHVLLDHL